MENSNNKIILKNTFFLYVRMFMKMIISLYTSRIILEYLGIIDYGIYNVVGGIVILFSFINGSMAISVQRFLSYEIGRKNQEKINTIFSMSIFIHLLISILIFIIVELLGPYLFSQLTIPSERLSAAYIVFHISIISTCITFNQIPHTALLISYEKMNAYAFIGILDVILKLLVVFVLPYSTIDKLILYALLYCFSTIIISLSLFLISRKQFPFVKLSRIWDRNLFKELLAFAFWNSFSEFAWSAVGQGVNIVLNIFFMPTVNAARGIAIQVMGALNQFVVNFQTAMNPQIIKSYAENNTNQTLTIALKGTKYSFFLMFFLSLPFLFNIEYILTLWLKVVPPETMIFCQLAIIGILCDILSNVFAIVVKATGKIRNYQIIISILLFLNLPLSYLSLHLGNTSFSVYYVYIFISLIIMVVRVEYLKLIIGLTWKVYIKEVLTPVCSTSIIAILLPTLTYQYTDGSFTRFCLHILMCILSCILAIYFVGLDSNEKVFIINKIKSKIK